MARHATALTIAVGFEMAFYSRSDVSAWVDECVDSVEAVSGTLLELVTLRDKTDHDIGRLLFEMAEITSSADLARARLGVVYRLLTSNRMSLREATARMYSIALQGFTWEEEPSEYAECLRLDDAYELAANQSYGTIAEVERDVLAFLEPYSVRLDVSG